jgi:Kdo2-lipid IVA lauroyltransferase/acyltransferase
MLPLFKILSYLPLRALHALGFVAGWGVFLLGKTFRQRFLDNARQAGFSFHSVRAAVGHIGCMVAELPRLWLGATPAFEWDNVACVDAAYAEGKGVLFLTPHLGCFEITAQALALRYSDRYGALTVLFRPARKAYLAPLMVAARQRPGLETAPTNLSGVRQMIKALRQGRAIGLLPDQVPPLGMGAWAPFFGRDAYTMTLAVRLVHQTGAQIRLIWGERLDAGRGYRLHCSELDAPLAESMDAALAQMNGAITALVSQCPSQYLWSYARYKTPRVDT